MADNYEDKGEYEDDDVDFYIRNYDDDDESALVIINIILLICFVI